METREYFEKVMQDYNQNRKGRSLRKYCKDEAVDYDWLIEFKKSYRSNKLQPDENKKLGEGEFIALTVEENFVPEQQTPAGWQVERLILKSPTGDEMEIKCTNLLAVAELQVSLQQGSSDEKAIREEISRMNLRQVEIMDVMVEIQEYILGKQEALLALLRERKSLLTAKEALEKKNKEYEEKLFSKSYKLLENK